MVPIFGQVQATDLERILKTVSSLGSMGVTVFVVYLAQKLLHTLMVCGTVVLSLRGLQSFVSRLAGK